MRDEYTGGEGFLMLLTIAASVGIGLGLIHLHPHGPLRVLGWILVIGCIIVGQAVTELFWHPLLKNRAQRKYRG
jgi:hypothetical protein